MTGHYLGNLGRVGVVLFFIHTSLVLMLSLQRDEEKISWIRFMVRRIFRIYPLAIIGVLVYFPLAIPETIWLPSGSSADLNLRTFLINISLLQNVFPAADVPSVLWSLPFEVQMYALLPFLFVLVRNRSRLDLIALWLIFAACALMGAVFAPGPIATFCQYVPCFMGGVICFGLKRSEKLPAWLLPIVLVTVVYFYTLTNAGARTAIGFWPLCLGLGLLIPNFREMRSPIATRCFAIIAKYSFGIYLSHVLCLHFAIKYLGGFGIALAIPATLLVSWLAFHAIEQPMIRAGKHIGSAIALRQRKFPSRCPATS
jgi:peptidoglycan/LPS O-acetylase OafA/YrhL